MKSGVSHHPDQSRPGATNKKRLQSLLISRNRLFSHFERLGSRVFGAD
jgi:hypothetical protein